MVALAGAVIAIAGGYLAVMAWSKYGVYWCGTSQALPVACGYIVRTTTAFTTVGLIGAWIFVVGIIFSRVQRT